MTKPHTLSLGFVYDGWQGYQTSLLHAVAPLTPTQLAWRPKTGRRSVGELVRHIALGRTNWLVRTSVPDVENLLARVLQWETDDDGVRHVVEDAVPADDASVLAQWLECSWAPIQRALDEWTVADLAATYRHRWNGEIYAVSQQWTLWRIMAHDIHHGGQLAMMLALQDVEAFELRALGGHIVAPPLAETLDTSN